jgi:OOP family OmpA-OmpF porin
MNALKIISAAVLVSSSLAAAQAVAQEKFYAGGSIGSSSIDESIATGLIDSGTVDGKSNGFKMFGGYRFNPNLALELALVDLGKASYSGTFFGAPVTGGQVKVSGLNVSAVALHPVNPDFELFAKAGLFAWDAKASDTTGGVPFSGTNDGVNLSLGIGANYYFTKNVGARIEWEHFNLESDKASMLSAGIVVKF